MRMQKKKPTQETKPTEVVDKTKETDREATLNAIDELLDEIDEVLEKTEEKTESEIDLSEYVCGCGADLSECMMYKFGREDGKSHEEMLEKVRGCEKGKTVTVENAQSIWKRLFG